MVLGFEQIQGQPNQGMPTWQYDHASIQPAISRHRFARKTSDQCAKLLMFRESPGKFLTLYILNDSHPTNSLRHGALSKLCGISSPSEAPVINPKKPTPKRKKRDGKRQGPLETRANTSHISPTSPKDRN